MFTTPALSGDGTATGLATLSLSTPSTARDGTEYVDAMRPLNSGSKFLTSDRSGNFFSPGPLSLPVRVWPPVIRWLLSSEFISSFSILNFLLFFCSSVYEIVYMCVSARTTPMPSLRELAILALVALLLQT